MTEVQAPPAPAGAGHTHRREPASITLGRTAAQLAIESAADLSSARAAAPDPSSFDAPQRTDSGRHRRTTGAGNVVFSMLRNAGRGSRGAPR